MPPTRWRAFRDRFHIPDPTVIYLDGNSLGMPPKRTLERLTEVYHDDWATGLIRSWDHWVDMPQRVGDVLAPLIGAAPGRGGAARQHHAQRVPGRARGDRPATRAARVIAISEDDFPTDRYVVDGIADALGLHRAPRLRSARRRRRRRAVGHRLSHRRTGRRRGRDRPRPRRRRDGGVGPVARGGAIDIDLHACGAQLAIGCSYKFLNGGPGAPAWTYVAQELHDTIRQPIWGWFATEDMFAMGPTFSPRPDIARMMLGTPSILALAAAEVGIALSAEAGMPAIHAKGSALTGFAIDLCDQFGLATPTPRDPARRGNHVAVAAPEREGVGAANSPPAT